LWNGSISIHYFNGSDVTVEGPIKIHAEESDAILKILAEDLRGDNPAPTTEEEEPEPQYCYPEKGCLNMTDRINMN
jgi:hypothetical protein